jgi:drug/metabolite transporter (DMT)-like permease
MMGSARARGHLAMLIFSALVAGSFSLGVTIANLIDPRALTSLRFLIAALVVGGVVFAGPGLRRTDFTALWRYGILGGLFAFYFVLMFEGLKTAAPVSASAVFTLTPLMSAIAGYFLLRQITTKRMALALAIAAAGALWVIFRADLAALLAFDIGRGELIFFLGSVAHAVYVPMARKLNRGEPAIVFTFGMLLAGFAILTVLSLPEVLATDWAALPLRFWLILLYLAIITGAVTFFLLQYATLHLPSAKVMAYTYLTPAWVIGWEWVQGNGLPPVLVAVGVVLIVVALLMLIKDEAPS